MTVRAPQELRAPIPLIANRKPLTPAEIWQRYDADEQRLSAPLSERMLELAQLRPGMRVLDLASGRGEPAIRAAHRVGPTGAVVGVDIDPSMLQMARERATREGLTNLHFHAANAEHVDELALMPCAVTLARWGFMYFAAPVVALAAARSAMIPGGMLVAAVWAEPARVPYYTLPRQLLARYLPVPAIDVEAPGTFRYADEGRLRQDLALAGYRVEYIEEMLVPVMEAHSDFELVAWTRAFGLSRLLDGAADTVQAAWEADMRAAFAQLQVDGCVRLGGVTRLVCARSMT